MKHIFLILLVHISSYAQNPCTGVPTVDYGRRTYNTVQMGSQCWLKENLDIGTMIIGIDTAKNNGIIEKYCYNDDTANCTIYGGLYQWNEAMQYLPTPGSKGICPTGWHIPTSAELTTLAKVNNNGNSLKAVGQGTGNGAGNNTSGFSVLLAGFRHYDGSFRYLGNMNTFWSSAEYTKTYANIIGLAGSDSSIAFGNAYKEYGFSIRCLKDISTGINYHYNNTLPNSVHLLQNYPNPFNPSTVITYSLPSASDVKLIVYNSLGQTIKVLENDYKNSGNYSIAFNTSDLPSGIYFYKLEAGQFRQVKKMILVK